MTSFVKMDSRMAELSPAKFYGGETKKEYTAFLSKLARISKQADIFEQLHFPCKRKLGAFAPSSVWNCFATQSQALEDVERCKAKIDRNIHVFAKELSKDGKRQYIVTTYHEFWNRYLEIAKKERNFYELIPAGAPCRLYCDLEFSKEANPDVDGVEILTIFIHLVCYYLKKLFDIDCRRDEIIDLDSSTAVKFSRHLIFHLPGAVFADNKACGNFMKYVYEMARRKLDVNNEPEFRSLKSLDIKGTIITVPEDICVDKLFVMNKDGLKTFFCDLGVYTRNRNFRIFGSTKFGKHSHLLPSEQNCFEAKMLKSRNRNCDNDDEYNFFLDTLVCFDQDPRLEDSRILNFEDNRTIHGKQIHYTTLGYGMQKEEGHKNSPLPCLDAFILKQISKGGVQGVIRRWIHFPQTQTMVYDIDKNHWCDNIGRAHKSNHIYIVVDIKKAVFFQKCHDPDCQIMDYKSEERPLPADLNLNGEWLNGSDFLIELFDESSKDLIEAAEVAELEGCLEDEYCKKEKQDIITDKAGQEARTEVNAVPYDKDFWQENLPLVSSNDTFAIDGISHGMNAETYLLPKEASVSCCGTVAENDDKETNRTKDKQMMNNEAINYTNKFTSDSLAAYDHHGTMKNDMKLIIKADSNLFADVKLINYSSNDWQDKLPILQDRSLKENQTKCSFAACNLEKISPRKNISHSRFIHAGNKEDANNSSLSTNMVESFMEDNEMQNQNNANGNPQPTVDCPDSVLCLDDWDFDANFSDELIRPDNEIEKHNATKLNQLKNTIFPTNTIASTPFTNKDNDVAENKNLKSQYLRSQINEESFEDMQSLAMNQPSYLTTDEQLSGKYIKDNSLSASQAKRTDFSLVRDDLSCMFLDESMSDADLIHFSN